MKRLFERSPIKFISFPTVWDLLHDPPTERLHTNIVLEPGQYHLGDGSDVCGSVNENFSYAVLPEPLSSGKAGNVASPYRSFSLYLPFSAVYNGQH